MPQGLLVNLGLMVAVAAFALLTSVSNTVALAMAGGAVLCAGAVRRLEDIPRLGLFAVTALVALSSIGGKTEFGLINSTSKLVFIPAFGLLLLSWALGQRRLWVGAQGMLALTYSGVAIVSCVVNQQTPLSIPTTLRIVNQTMLFLLAINVLESESDIRRLLAVVVASCTLSALGGLILRPVGGTVGTSDRLAGLTEQMDAPTFAFFLSAALLISLYYALTGRDTTIRVMLLCVASILLYAVMATAARSGIITLVLAVPYMLFRLRKRVSMLPLALFGLLAAAIVAASPGLWQTRMSRLFTRPEQDAPLMWRYQSAMVAWQIFQQRPLLGNGPGNFTMDYMSEDFRFDRVPRAMSVVGNSYVRILYETGIVGFVLFALLVLVSLRDLHLLGRIRRGLATGTEAGNKPQDTGPPALSAELGVILEVLLFSILVFALFGAFEREKYLWMVLAAISVLARIQRRELGGGAAADPVCEAA